MNLLQETMHALGVYKKTPSDVLWVGIKNLPELESIWPKWSEDVNILEMSWPWRDFVKIADFEYDNGYGGQEIHWGLVIVGKDWWLERHEYDGKEWWEFKMLPERPNVGKILTRDLIYKEPKDLD